MNILVTLATAFVLAAVPQGPAQPVDRVVVRYHDQKFDIVSRIPLTKVLAPSDPLPPSEIASGFWFELRGASGDVRYRRLAADPTRLVFEGATQNAAGAPAVERMEGAAKDRTFSVLVPRAKAGDRLVFYGIPPDAKQTEPLQASKPIANLELIPPSKPIQKKGGVQ